MDTSACTFETINGIRIIRLRGGRTSVRFKDKKKYNRKQKHRKGYDE